MKVLELPENQYTVEIGPSSSKDLVYIRKLPLAWLLISTVQVFPAHGAGSPCGKNLSNKLYSTIGDEKATNPALSFDKVSCLAVCIFYGAKMSLLELHFVVMIENLSN